MLLLAHGQQLNAPIQYSLLKPLHVRLRGHHAPKAVKADGMFCCFTPGRGNKVIKICHQKYKLIGR